MDFLLTFSDIQFLALFSFVIWMYSIGILSACMSTEREKKKREQFASNLPKAFHLVGT